MHRTEEELKNVIRYSLSKAFESLLGGNGLYVLRFHVERRLDMDMYEAFYEDPHKFYKAVEDFLGEGAEALMRLIIAWLIQNGYLEVANLTADNFMKLLKEGGEMAKIMIRSSFRGESKGVVGGW